MNHVAHRSRWRSLVFVISSTFILVFLSAGTFWGIAPRAETPQSDDAFQQELEKAQSLLLKRKYDDALKSFKRANDLREKKCIECYVGMARAYQFLEAYKNVIDSCDKVIELAGADTRIAGLACNMKGIALQSQSDGKDMKKLAAAEAAFRQGITLDEKLYIVRYNLGMVLLQQNKDPEGVAELTQYVKLEPFGSHTEEAKKLIENPRRARENYAPDFSITTADGEYISSDDLRGKVVLLDFWGTWCPPCRASVPALRDLNKRYAKETAFVMIGIASENEAEPWRAFTTENKMVWPQYLDKERKIVRVFNVRAFPTYIVIDHEGIIRFRSIGTSWERSGNLDEIIRKQVKIVSKSAVGE